MMVYSAHRVVVFGPRRTGVSGTHGGAVVGLARGVEHVHHGHAQVHSQRIDYEEAVAGEQRQAVTRRAASRRCRKTHDSRHEDAAPVHWIVYASQTNKGKLWNSRFQRSLCLH